ncbi:Gag polyprotein [Labeo rohita]|uniref:Gag polyprotein n=1 Tax=Labeo rohita TaxID=84645 RepID=A0ABQ8L381_LABRO|nr:Gag polyprotein [Labeo rohita]
MSCSPVTKPEYAKHELDLPSDTSDLVRQIGSEIGEAIRDSLLQTRHSSLSPSGCFGENTNFSDTKMSNATIIDASKLVLKSEKTAPSYYRGEAAEVAEQGFREEGITLENRSRELAVMFIRHFPDKKLSLVFKSKPAQLWTASEVQEKLDKMLREQKASRRIACQQTPKVLEPIDDSTSLSPHRSETATPAADNGALDKVLTMLEKALVCNAQSVRGGWSKNAYRQSRECRVCTSKDHSTTAHCNMYNLCFKCFSSGHMSFNCEKTVPRESTGRQGDDAPQGN